MHTYADDLKMLEGLTDQFTEEELDDALPSLVRVATRVLARPVIQHRGMQFNRPLQQQLFQSVDRAARTLIRRRGPSAIRALPYIVQRVGQNAARHRLPIRALSHALRRTTARVVANPALTRHLSQSQPHVGTYRSVRGHHIHQAASYGGPGASRRTNPNYQDAVTIAHGSGFTRQQHRRADAVQRNVNRAYLGRSVHQPQVGNVQIQARGLGSLPATPNPYLEDMKAYYALRAAGVPPEQSLELVHQSATQLEQSRTQPVRVPSR